MKHLFLCLAIFATVSTLADGTSPASTGPDYSDALAVISSKLEENANAINNLKTTSEANTRELVAALSNLTVHVTQALDNIRTSMNNTILIPTPDYNSKMEVESGYCVAAKGFIMMTTKSAPKSGYRYAFINNVRVFIPLSERATEFDCVHYGIYPVTAGDVITLPNAENYIKLFWVPAK